MPTAVWWTIYKTFNDPPGKQGLKCITCRYATAGAATVLGLGGIYGAYRTMGSNAYTGMGFVFVSVIGFGATAIAIRSANEESKWNERLIQDTMKKLAEERGEFKKANQLTS